MHGESCYDFYRECKYYGQCTLSTAVLTDPFDASQSKVEEYQIELTLAQLIEAQLSKSDIPAIAHDETIVTDITNETEGYL